MKKIISIAMGCILMAAIVHAGTIEDFESFSPSTWQTSATNAAVVGADTWSGGFGTASIVDESNTGGYGTDPFGGVNQSLRLTKTDLNTGNVGFIFDRVSGAGSFTMNFHVLDGQLDDGRFIMRLHDADDTTGIATTRATMFDTGFSGTMFRYYTSSGWVTFDNAYTTDANYSLVINFDTTAGTKGEFSGTLNGVPLTTGGGTVSTFGFNNAVTDVEVLQLDAFNKRLDAYVDNLSVVPEPATLGLLGLGGLAIFIRRKLHV